MAWAPVARSRMDGNAEIALAPGELLVISNPVVMDAGGIWQLTIEEAHWIEAMREERTF